MPPTTSSPLASLPPNPLPPNPWPESSAPKLSPPKFLNHDDLGTVIRLAPLIAIDFVIRNACDDVLLGLRNNEPAKDWYFVPGGMVLKDERTRRIDDARLIGAFEHFYKNNRFGNSDYGTHYVVLGYELKAPDAAEPKADDQHSELRWWPLAELLASDRVHKNTKAYFER
jgi:colanic acid biosynthesis protein WcaH